MPTPMRAFVLGSQGEVPESMLTSTLPVLPLPGALKVRRSAPFTITGEAGIVNVRLTQSLPVLRFFWQWLRATSVALMLVWPSVVLSTKRAPFQYCARVVTGTASSSEP
jgi:hypothetical protein